MADQQNLDLAEEQTQAPAPAPQEPATQAPLPQEAKEKTREQFEKLLESNRRLFEANERLRKEMEARSTSNKTFEPIQNVPQQPQQKANDFVEVDPVTGDKYINDAKLQSRIDELSQRASRAEQAVQSYIKTTEQKEIERQNKEAFAAYPELNPNAKETFDEAFHKQVRGLIFDSMYNPDDYGGRPLGFKEAADVVSGQMIRKTKKEEKKEAAKGTTPTQDQKADASADLTSTPQNAPQPTNDAETERLRMATRYGDDAALAKRLLATEHINQK